MIFSSGYRTLAESKAALAAHLSTRPRTEATEAEQEAA